MTTSIRAIDSSSIHKITSGQVVIDLQTAVKELVENSLDAGATNVEVKFKEYGLKFVEVVDNGSGIAEEDYDSIALNHHTSKLTSFSSLTTLTSFGFRGEALSSLCALCESVVVTTATDTDGQKGVGTKLEMGRCGEVVKKSVVARQRGTTITLTNPFAPLPVRRKEFERNAKREFGKAMGLLTGYALVPCASTTKGDSAKGKGVRLTITNTLTAGKKQTNVLSPGSGSSTLATAQGLWGSKALESVTEFALSFSVEGPKSRLSASSSTVSTKAKEIQVEVRGLISKFALGCGRTGTDRQFFYVNGRPCALGKIQKAFNEVYKSFNTNQSPFVVADFIVPGDAVDINVSPDKRTIFLHSEDKLVVALKTALDETFSTSRSTYAVGQSFQPQVQPLKQTLLATTSGTTSTTGIGNSHARNQSQNSEAKRKLSDVQEDLDTGEPHDPSVASDALTQDDNSSGDVRMGEPHLLIETPDVSHRRQDISGVDVPMVDDRPSIGAHDQPPITVGPTPSKASDVAALRQEAGYMEAEETEPRIETIQSSLESDSQISESLGPLRNSTPNTSIASLSSHTGHASQGGLSGSTGSSTRAPSVPYSRPEVNTRTSSRRSVQMVLSTAGASWNLRRGGGDVEPPRKKSRTSEPENAMDTSGEGKGNKGRDARQNLRHRLSSFARAGSQIVNDEVEVVGLSGDDAAEVDELQEEDEDELTNLGRQRKKAGYNSEGYGDMDLDVHPEEDIHNKSGLSTAIDADDVPPVIKSQAIKVESEVIDLTHDNGHDGSRDIAILKADRSVSDIQSQQFGEGIARPEIIRSADSESVSMRFDLSKVSDIWLQLRDKLLSTPSVSDLGAESMPSFERDAGVSNLEDDKKAIDALSRVIDKEDFGWMEIIGQFNLGFIVTRRRKAIDQEGRDMDDLFIVDQHAADEKYNFETLQQTTRIKSQKLFRPQSLELTAADELLAIENIEILRQNGFEVGEVDDPNIGLGHRLQLVAQPVSKGTDFDMKDLEELLHLMQDRPTGQMVRCSKARAMFAMRACRKSVMVGMPLPKSQMTSIVQHMGTIDQPWNCPHGRPTMRHLSDIANLGRGTAKTVEWGAFALPQ